MPSFARHLAHPVVFFKSVKVGQRTRGFIMRANGKASSR